MKEYLLFDLDGTLTDPKIGITTCVQYALKEFGIDEPDLDKLEPFIGPPLKNSFMEFYNFTEEQAEQAIEKYRERFSTIGLFENKVYEGIPQMLRQLQSCGMFLAVASSKPTEFVERILEHFDLRKYFKVVVGSELDGTRVEKEEVVMEALRQLFSYKPINYPKVYMIGDRKYDVEGAKKVGVESIGVTYGYGSMEELKEAHADYIVRDVEELRTLLMREGEALKKSREEKQQGQEKAQTPKTPFQKLWSLIYPLLMFMLVKSLAGSVLMMLVSGLRTSITGSLAELFFVYDEAGELVSLTGNMSNIVNALAYVVSAGMMYNAAKVLIGRSKEEDKLKHIKKDSPKSYILFGVVAVCGVIGLNIFLELGGMTENVKVYELMVQEGYMANLILAILCSGIAIPVAEEIVFRGVIYNRVKKRYRMKQALVLAALLYSVYHMDSVQSVYAFALGLLLVYSYEYFGTFLAPVILHVAANTVTYVICYTPLVKSPLFSWPVCLACLLIAAMGVKLILEEKKII